MSKVKFDPDKPHVKIRGIGSVHYEQNGCKFTAGFKYIGLLKESEKSDSVKEKTREDVRSRAAAKIAQKRGGLEDYRQKETPDAVSNANKENEAARQAEEHAE